MKKILAVSGGIDSVVMLHLYRNDPDVVVAHFNHNIRPNSSEDQSFVAKLAQKYGKDFVTEDANLRVNASEADARAARYAFLDSVCFRYHGKIHVAHHKDDVYESIAINILRGTGWRGLAPLQNPQIVRPLLSWSKRDIYFYASKNNLSFRQDQTNTEDAYLRNRIRMRMRFATNSQKDQLYQLYRRQCEISSEVSRLFNQIEIGEGRYYPRSLFQGLDDQLALELLREILQRNSLSQTRPQLLRAVDAIRNYLPEKQFPLGANALIRITKNNFIIKHN